VIRFILAIAIFFSATESTAGETWSDRDICRAATKTYFWLSELPSDAPNQGQYMGFRSAKQNYYTCRVDDRVADFRWLNKSSESMKSRSTKIVVSDGTLTVISDMKTERFTKSK